MPRSSTTFVKGGPNPGFKKKPTGDVLEAKRRMLGIVPENTPEPAKTAPEPIPVAYTPDRRESNPPERKPLTHAERVAALLAAYHTPLPGLGDIRHPEDFRD